VAGRYFEPPKLDRPEARGHRIQFSPRHARTDDTFLTVLLMCEGDTPPPPVTLETLRHAYLLHLAGRTVLLSHDGRRRADSLSFSLPGTGNRLLLLTGLAPGPWRLTDAHNQAQQFTVTAKNNTASLTLPPGPYRLQRQ